MGSKSDKMDWLRYELTKRTAVLLDFVQIKVIGTIFGECLNYKSVLRISIWPLEVPFFGGQRHFCTFGKVTFFGPQKIALRVAESKF